MPNQSGSQTFRPQHVMQDTASDTRSAGDWSLLIQPVDELDLDAFVCYLNDHFADNGSAEAGYFAPRPRGAPGLPPNKEREFRDALMVPIGNQSWRRAWFAKIPGGLIAGHVDLRAHSMPWATHRCLLGMGVRCQYRQRGLGATLLEYALSWAKSQAFLEWIDLHVLSTNERAIRLYLRKGFTKVSEVTDMFRADGLSLSDIAMTKRVHGCM